MKLSVFVVPCFVMALLIPAMASAEPALDLSLNEASIEEVATARIDAALADLAEPCQRLRNRSFWAEATSLATASIAVALGGGSFATDGTVELALRLTGVVLAGVSAGASYLGRAYGEEYREHCGATALGSAMTERGRTR